MVRLIDANKLSSHKFVGVENFHIMMGRQNGKTIIEKAINNAYRIGWNHAIEAIIENEPTVTVEPELTEEQAIDKLHETGWLPEHDRQMTERPQGEWINEYYDGGWFHTCNRCKEELKATGEDNFCPNCGAKMKGTKNDK